MSRVGKKPVPIPEKTKITYENRVITVQGDKGTLTRSIHPAVDLKIEDGVLNVVVLEDKRTSRALQGLTRSLVANMIVGRPKSPTWLGYGGLCRGRPRLPSMLSSIADSSPQM